MESELDLRQRLAITFERTADVLEESARLAADDARRRAAQGELEMHAIERERADRALEASRRARTAAQRLGRPGEQSPGS